MQHNKFISLLVLLLLTTTQVAAGMTETANITTSGRNFFSGVVNSTDGMAYFGSHVGVGANAKISKIDTSTFTEIANLTLSVQQPLYSGCIDEPAGFLYWGTDAATGKIAKIRLSNFTEVANITTSNNAYLVSCTINTTDGFVYFEGNTAPNIIVTKVALSNFTEVGTLTTTIAAPSPSMVSDTNGFIYSLGGSAASSVSKIAESNFTEVGTLVLSIGHSGGGVIDNDNGFAYFASETYPAKVSKVRLSNFTEAANLTLGIDNAWACTKNGNFMYCADEFSNKVSEIRLSNFTENSTLTTSASAFDGLISAVSYGNFIYLGENTNPANVYKIQVANAQLMSTFMPPTPVIDAAATGNFFVNTTWHAGTGNVTDSFNVSINGSWTNGTTSTFINTTGMSPHGWANYSIYAWNSSSGGTLNTTPATSNVQIPNNAITISGVLSSYTLTEGDVLTITPSYSDADSDTPTFSDNSSKWNVDSGTGVVSWTTASGDAGTYVWGITVSDGYGSTATAQFTVTIAAKQDEVRGGGCCNGGGGIIGTPTPEPTPEAVVTVPVPTPIPTPIPHPLDKLPCVNQFPFLDSKCSGILSRLIPMNWWLLVFAYISSFLTLMILSTIDGREKSYIIDMLLYGTVTIILVQLAVTLGINAYVIAYIMHSAKPLFIGLSFAAWAIPITIIGDIIFESNTPAPKHQGVPRRRGNEYSFVVADNRSSVIDMSLAAVIIIVGLFILSIFVPVAQWV